MWISNSLWCVDADTNHHLIYRLVMCHLWVIIVIIDQAGIYFFHIVVDWPKFRWGTGVEWACTQRLFARFTFRFVFVQCETQHLSKKIIRHESNSSCVKSVPFIFSKQNCQKFGKSKHSEILQNLENAQKFRCCAGQEGIDSVTFVVSSVLMLDYTMQDKLYAWQNTLSLDAELFCSL